MIKKVYFRGINKPVVEREISFDGASGQNIEIKRNNVKKLHEKVLSNPKFKNKKILEVSSKSDKEIGVNCSAFNLKMDGAYFESIFQSSKVFEGNLQFEEVLYDKPGTAKKYVLKNRLKRDLIKFRYKGVEYPNLPRTLFYDYMYCKCLNENKDIDKDELVKYSVFTDIEFGGSAINCQAKSMCIYTYLYKYGLLDEALSDIDKFKELVYKE